MGKLRHRHVRLGRDDLLAGGQSTIRLVPEVPDGPGEVEVGVDARHAPDLAHEAARAHDAVALTILGERGGMGVSWWWWCLDW